MKVRRVAFAGASGTGKSTLSTWIEATYSLPMNPVGSRTVAREMGLANAYESDAAGRRLEFQTRLIESKTAWEAAHDDFVTDRTTLDNLVYAMMHDAAGVTEAYLDLACKALSRYHYIVYCPTSVFINLGDDSSRLMNMTYHTLYDATLWGLLHKFRPPEVRLITMPFPKLEHRQEYLRTMLGPVPR